MKEAVLIPMVRSPRKGSVKKRLAAYIGEEAALGLYKNFVNDLLDALDDIDENLIIGYHPETDLQMMKGWLGEDRSFIPQTGRDLGDRQASLLERAFSMGYTKAAVMISDGPDIPVAYIEETFDLLDVNDCVIGPCHDGGYYLIGFDRSRYIHSLLLDMEWSDPFVVSNMIKRLDEVGLGHAFLPIWWDIDTVEDLKAYRRRASESGLPSRTLSYIRSSGVLDER